MIAALTTTLALALLGGCVSDGKQAKGEEPAASKPIAQRYRDDMDRMIAIGTDFEREIVSDYTITEAEMQHTKDSFVSCLADKGHTAFFEARGMGIAIGFGEAERKLLDEQHQDDLNVAKEIEDAVVMPCAQNTVMSVGMLYLEMTANPDDLSYGALTRQCLDKVGVTGEAAAYEDEELLARVDDESLGRDAKKHCSTGVYQ